MAVRQSALEVVVIDVDVKPGLPTSAFWQGKKVLVTGHTGFKGGWLALWLRHLGAEVCGIALPTESGPALFTLAGIADGIQGHYCDIRDQERLAGLIRGFAPEIVLHLAAQSLVRAGYRDPLATFATNVMGTAHVLDALRDLAGVRVAVMVTTDKVYQNREWPYPYREEDALGGHDPYSASKAAAEMVAASYRDAFLAGQGVAVATVRAGNVIGGGDWSENRLIPDAVRAWQSGQPLLVRRPQAIRPWQHVLEPLAGYLVLAEKLWDEPRLAGAYNFGPEPGGAVTVRQVVELARQTYGQGETLFGDGDEGPHEAGWLALEIAKARADLGVQPRWSLAETVGRTMNWYRRLAEGAGARGLCEADIADYEAGR